MTSLHTTGRTSFFFFFFYNVSLFTQSSWQLDYVRGDGMWAWGNLRYVTGPLTGNGKQWWAAPEWKALGFGGRGRGESARKKPNKKSERKVQVTWSHEEVGFLPKEGFFKQNTPKWLTNLCLGGFKCSVTAKCAQLLSPSNENTHTHTHDQGQKRESKQ